MVKEVVIKVDHVSKSFKLPTEPTNSLKTSMVNFFRGIKGYKKQEVLKDISFEVEKGDFFGIVGRNGSGKSTLLKILSKIYRPNSGQVTIEGKVVSFLELGVGFNGELTGRDNVYLSGTMYGFTDAEIDDMYDEIVAFAELEEFMDQKLKNYSSGMQVRLAFSVAIMAKGDILILDEVLAVGDEAFQRKSADFFGKIKKDKSKTIILVTHDMEAVRRFCNKAMLIEGGQTPFKSEDVYEVAIQYSKLFISEDSDSEDTDRYGNRKITFEKMVHKFDAEAHFIECTLKNHTSQTFTSSVNLAVDFFRDQIPAGGNHIQYKDGNVKRGLSFAPYEEKVVQIKVPNHFSKGEFSVNLWLGTDQNKEVLEGIRKAFVFYNPFGRMSTSPYIVPATVTDVTGGEEFEI